MAQMMEYRMGCFQLKKYFYTPLIKLISVIILVAIFSLAWMNLGKTDMPIVLTGTLAWVGLIHLLPFLVIAIRHKRISQGAAFSIDRIHGKYHYYQGSTMLLFERSQIKRVVKVVSPPKYDDRIDVLGFGHLFYWKVILTDGTTLIMSCMLLDSEEFFGENIEQEKKIFVMPPSDQKSFRPI